MTARAATSRYLALDELNPSVEMASHCRLGPAWYRYRVPGHHLVLLIDGTISASTPHGKFAARGGDLVCFRPAQLNEYGQRAPVVLYEAMVTFAPPPRHQLTPWIDGVGP